MSPTPTTSVPNFLGGKWIEDTTSQIQSPVHNPSTGEVIARVPHSGAKEIDRAAEAARTAFPHWAGTPAPKRAEFFHRYRRILEEHADEITRLITHENGKTLEESRGDLRRGIEVVEFACGIAHLLKGENLPQVANGIDGLTMREPLGVCAGITPFNFPAMVPMWMFPLAIACGNTFILKPSEKTPLTANKLAELFQEAGLPDGVMNVVHGGREAVDAICLHPGISSVSFVGSSAVAKHVYTLACSTGKRCQAAGGAKNVLLVMPDANPDSTLRAILGSAYGCSGQRCMAGSVLMPVGQKNADNWRERLTAALREMKIGDSNAGTFDMGPLIDESSRERCQSFVNDARPAGVEVFHADDEKPERGYFVMPTLLDGVKPEMNLFQQEIFGPVLSLVRTDALAEAIGLMNRLGYGNGATIFTASGAASRQFVHGIQCGMVGINIGVPAPMPLFPFSGWNQSFYGDLHVQGTEGVAFYTRQKVVLSRWDDSYVRTQGW